MDHLQNIYILGGHNLASSYMERLLQARKNGLIHFNNLTFIDPNPNPPALTKLSNQVQFINKTYSDFISDVVLNKTKVSITEDVLIPDHTAPHILFELFLKLIKNNLELSKGYQTTILPYTKSLGTPFQKTFDSGISAVSYATWVCPLECEEPAICPKINDTRTWDFNKTFSDLKKLETKEHFTLHSFFCDQLVNGIGFLRFDTISSEWKRLLATILSQDKSDFIVATFSHCHGIVGMADVIKNK